MPDSDQTQSTDARLLRIAPGDNVAVATTTIEAGESLMIDGVNIVFGRRVPSGHKVALVSIAAGTKVVKYGLPIGLATADIGPGEHVHIHNLKSDYYPTYTLDGANPYLPNA